MRLLAAAFLFAAIGLVHAQQSARAVAEKVLAHLAAGELEAAAAYSNAPRERLEVLRDYRDRVGESEFRRVFGEYQRRRIVEEIAEGPRRLLIWDLGETEQPFAGQIYVEVDGRFLLDDIPSPERTEMRRRLRAYREARPSR